MTYNIDFRVASGRQIEAALCKRLETIRLARNITQKELATQAGVSLRTIGRMEKGQGISFDTFIRVLTALNIQQNLEALLPDPAIRPIDRIKRKESGRKRARSGLTKENPVPWSWADGGGDDDD